MQPDESQDYWISCINSFAPEHMASLRKSATEALRLIDHPDSKVCAAAIMSCHAMWKMDLDRDYISKCCKLATNGSGDGRSAAVAVLDVILHRVKLPHIERVLAQVVKDEGASTLLRNSAYRALLESNGTVVAFDEQSDAARDFLDALNGRDVALAEIDWELIRTKCDDV